MATNTTDTTDTTEYAVTIPSWGIPILTFLCLLAYIELGGFFGSFALWIGNFIAVVSGLAFLFGRFMYKHNDELITEIVKKGEYKTKSQKSGKLLALYAFAYAVTAYALEMTGTQIIWAGLSFSILWTIFTLQARIKVFEHLKEIGALDIIEANKEA